MTDHRIPYTSAVATGRGDDGTTGLLYGGARVSKDNLATEAYGAVDEAVAALGLARAELSSVGGDAPLSPALASLRDLILRIQRELFVVGAELATNPDARDRGRDGVTRVSAAMLDALDATLRESEAQVVLPSEFVVPGETRLSAALELSRTILRRAERRAVTLAHNDEGLAGSLLLPYLNRLADLAWILARAAEQAEAVGPTAAIPGRPWRTRREAAPQEGS